MKYRLIAIVDSSYDEASLESAVDDLLFPFYDEYEVPRYVSLTREEAIDQRKEELEYTMRLYIEWQADSAAYEASGRTASHIDYLKSGDFLKDYNGTEAQMWQSIAQDYPDKDSAGNLYSTINPNGYWANYRMGDPKIGLFNTDPEGLACTHVRRRELKSMETPSAVVLKDGSWLSELNPATLERSIGDSIVKTSMNEYDDPAAQWASIVSNHIADVHPDDWLISVLIHL